MPGTPRTSSAHRPEPSRAPLCAWAYPSSTCRVGRVVGTGPSPLLADFDAVRDGLPPFRASTLARPWHPPSPRALFGLASRRLALPGLLGSVLPKASASLADLVPDGALAATATWPEGLWVCACRRDGGERTVFGRSGSPEATLPSAVAASCSIPGYLAPVVIRGTEFVDGGLHSPTNADVLRGRDLDVVIVVSPMSGHSRGIDRGLRQWAGRRLQAETRSLESDGVAVATFEPGPATSRLLGLNPMARTRSDRIVRSAYFEAGRHLLDPSLRDALAALDTRQSAA